MEITTVAGPSFFIRTVYLTLVNPEDIVEGHEFPDSQEMELLDAGLCFAAEHKAMDYLNRSEQYRLGLTTKLISKGYEKRHIEKALDYLEEKKYLDDRRFARVWLHNRVITHAEGRVKLQLELSSRGIAKDYINDALDEFFEEYSEEDLCLRAYKKCKRLKKAEEKIIPYLLKNGFSVKMIQRVKSNYGTEE